MLLSVSNFHFEVIVHHISFPISCGKTMSEENAAKEWVLDAETEYRFELDAGTSIAITVSFK